MSWKRYVSCETTPTSLLSAWKPRSRTSIPPIVESPAADVVQARGEVAERRLAGAGLSDDRGRRAGGNCERDIPQRPLVPVAEPDVVVDDITRPALENRIRLLVDVDGLVEVLEDPVEERERGLHVQADPEQRSNREEEPGLEGRERDQQRNRHRVRAARQEETAEPVDGRRHDREARLDRGHDPAAGHALTHLEVGEVARLVLEPVRELVPTPHRLAEQDPGDRERFLDEAGDVGERLLRVLRDPAALVADAPGQKREERDQREGKQGELPAQQEHADHRRDDRRGAGRDRRGGVRHDVLDAADVVRDARLHLARARPREERERKPLQVAEDGRAEVVHHALADLVRKQRLDHAEHPDGDRDRDDRGGVQRERACVVRADRLEHALEQERRHDSERRREDDQRQQAAEAQFVRGEQVPDAAEVRTALGRIGRPLGHLVGVVEEHAHRLRLRGGSESAAPPLMS